MDYPSEVTAQLCQACSYPYTGKACGNPACFSNPNVPEATKAAWRERAAKQAAEDAERARFNRIRDACYAGRTFVLAFALLAGACSPTRIEPQELEAARAGCERAPVACEGWRFDR